ncbi:hypothetical protein NA56DRAFT_713016 [Hyaloscypha hepaticicola]|uniref:Uncharacterized protein n=1 Tax=Hyaloscypha hepaticicola TaxID=2082293 RepID=A0A2J6PF26_9HELO|nr:hypothetical protein NA56DRAFT_713016 [Hyaloscypha hepaticicola]
MEGEEGEEREEREERGKSLRSEEKKEKRRDHHKWILQVCHSEVEDGDGDGAGPVGGTAFCLMLNDTDTGAQLNTTQHNTTQRVYPETAVGPLIRDKGSMLEKFEMFCLSTAAKGEKGKVHALTQSAPFTFLQPNLPPFHPSTFPPFHLSSSAPRRPRPLLPTLLLLSAVCPLRRLSDNTQETRDFNCLPILPRGCSSALRSAASQLTRRPRHAPLQLFGYLFLSLFALQFPFPFPFPFYSFSLFSIQHLMDRPTLVPTPDFS